MKKGDRAKVIANESHHFFEIGSEVQIVKHIPYDNGTNVYRAHELGNPTNIWRVLETDLEYIKVIESNHKSPISKRINKRKRMHDEW